MGPRRLEHGETRLSGLLDSHVLVWWFEAQARLSEAVRSVLGSRDIERPLLVSDVSLAEIGRLVGRRRRDLGLPVREWLEHATAAPLVRACPITPAIAAETVHLPRGFPRDPVDRIIAATARVMGAALVTMDAAIIRSGAVPTLS